MNRKIPLRQHRQVIPSLEELESRSVPAIADLAVTVTDGLAQMTDRSVTTYTIRVVNNGPEAATSATIADDFPSIPLNVVNWAAQASGGASVTQVTGTGDFSIGANLPVGGVVTIRASLVLFPHVASGALVNTVSAGLGPGDTDPNPANNTASDTTAIGRVSISDSFGSSPHAVSSDAGAPAHVKVFDSQTGQLVASFLPFGDFGGGVRVATGDVTGDGRDDVVVAAGPGAGPHVKVYDGSTMKEVASFFAFDPAFRGGVFVAVAHLYPSSLVGPVSQNFNQVVVGADAGADPHVAVFSVRNGQAFPDTPLQSFLAYDAGFRGGVRVAAGNIDGVPGDEVITSPGPGAAPHIKAFAYAGNEVASFLAYDSAFLGGVFVAVGNLDGIGPTEIITGTGAGDPSHVKVWNGVGGERASFLAFGDAFRGGVRVATTDRGVGQSNLILGAGPGAGPHVRMLSDTTFTDFASFFAFDADFTGGVFVG